MKKYGIIATWYMAYDGIEKATNILKNDGLASVAIVEAIKDVEDNPKFKSVGFGGLPNEECVVELDAGIMDGKTLNFGAVGAIHDIKNPIEVANKLSKNKFNNVLVGKGADKFAEEEKFLKQNMLSKHAEIEYNKKIKDINDNNLSAYDGHDTVSMVCLDTQGNIVSATSTSGLFMKKKGRIGDSPIVGSGFYADNEIGGACATGVGEEIMKGVLSYEVVRKMKDGMTPQKACEATLKEFNTRLTKAQGNTRAISLIAFSTEGEWGVSTNVEFTFVVSSNEIAPTIYQANPINNKIEIKKVFDISKWESKEEHKLTQ